MVQGMILAVAAAACMGLLAVLAKLGYRTGLTDVELLHYRFLFAAASLGAVLAIQRPGRLKAGPAILLKAAVLGGGIYFVMSRCFFRALLTIPAATASLALYLYPLVVTLASAPLFGQRITRRTWASLGAVLAGCGLIFAEAFAGGADPVGVGFALASMLAYSAYLLASQVFLRQEDPLAMSFWIFVFAALSFSLIHDPLGVLDLNGPQLAVCLALGLVPCALAIVMLNVAIRRLGGALVSVLSCVEPAVTVTAAALWLDEPLAGAQLAGMALVMAGVAMPGLALLRLAPARPAGNWPASS